MANPGGVMKRDYWDRVDEYRQRMKDGDDPHTKFVELIKPDAELPTMDRSDVAALRARAKVTR